MMCACEDETAATAGTPAHLQRFVFYFCLFYFYSIYYRAELLLEKSGISVALPPCSCLLAGSARSAPFLSFFFLLSFT